MDEIPTVTCEPLQSCDVERFEIQMGDIIKDPLTRPQNYDSLFQALISWVERKQSEQENHKKGLRQGGRKEGRKEENLQEYP